MQIERIPHVRDIPMLEAALKRPLSGVFAVLDCCHGWVIRAEFRLQTIGKRFINGSADMLYSVHRNGVGDPGVGLD